MKKSSFKRFKAGNGVQYYHLITSTCLINGKIEERVYRIVSEVDLVDQTENLIAIKERLYS